MWYHREVVESTRLAFFSYSEDEASETGILRRRHVSVRPVFLFELYTCPEDGK